MMADIREKLTRLVLDAPKTDTVYGNIKLPKPVQTARTIVDNLIGGGVVIPVRCGECRHWVPEDSRKDYGVCHCFGNKRGIWRRVDGYCDKGEPREE